MRKVTLLLTVIVFLARTPATAQYWFALGTGIKSSFENYGYFGNVKWLTRYNGDLYAGGSFDTAGGNPVNNIARWNGSSWSAPGSGITGDVYCMSVYNGELYAGGWIQNAGGIPVNNIAKWNGTSWSAVGSGLDDAIYSLCVYNGELYAGGYFLNAGAVPVNQIAKWNGTSWSAVGAGTDGPVISLLVHNNELYAGGIFYLAGGVASNNIAKWNGSAWSALGSGTDGAVLALAEYNNNVYAGGWFVTAGSVPVYFIARWDGTAWSALGGGLTPGNYGWAVQTLAVYHNALYVGGELTGAGNIPVSNIAKWNGTDWSDVGGGTDAPTLTLTADDTTLYVGGFFGNVNSNLLSASRVGRWKDDCVIPPPRPGGISGRTGVCPGSNQVYYITPVNGASGYTWTLPPGWSGSSTSTSITTIAGINGGTISVTANNGCGNSAAETLAVTILTAPPQPGPISGNSLVCTDRLQTYSVYPVPGATAYTWILPPSWTGYSTTNSISVNPGTGGGTITVVARNECGFSPSQTMTVAVQFQVPGTPDFIIGNDQVCEGNTEIYSVRPVPDALSYTWTLPAGWQGSSSSDYINSIAGSGSGYVSVIANNSCGSSPERVLAVNADQVPPQPGFISGNSLVCQSIVQVYSVNLIPTAADYTWSLPPGWTGSSNTNSITARVGPNGGNIIVQANNRCGSSIPRVFPATVGTVPSQPRAISGNTTASPGQVLAYSIDPVNGAGGYNWSLTGGGNIVGGQNSSTVTIKWQTAGRFILAVSALNDCGAGSEEKINIEVIQQDNPDPFSLKLFPNPALGEIFLKAKRVGDKTIRVEIFNSSGQLVYRSGPQAGSNDYSQRIDLKGIAVGQYAARIAVDNEVFVKLFVKVK